MEKGKLKTKNIIFRIMPKLRVARKTEGGGDDNAANNSIASRTAIERYAPFGQLGQMFQSQGWYPTSFHGTEFRPQYGLFSDVPLRDGKGRGYVAVDHSGNGMFDLSIKDKDGKVVENIIKGANPKDINTYLTNYGNQQSQGNFNAPSPIAQRVMQIQQGVASR